MRHTEAPPPKKGGGRKPTTGRERIAMDRVTTICYGQRREWADRWEAVEFFKEGVISCDGSEAERYTAILLKLLAGETECEDS